MSGEAFPICRLVAGMMPCDAHRLGHVPVGIVLIVAERDARPVRPYAVRSGGV